MRRCEVERPSRENKTWNMTWKQEARTGGDLVLGALVKVHHNPPFLLFAPYTVVMVTRCRWCLALAETLANQRLKVPEWLLALAHQLVLLCFEHRGALTLESWLESALKFITGYRKHQRGQHLEYLALLLDEVAPRDQFCPVLGHPRSSRISYLHCQRYRGLACL